MPQHRARETIADPLPSYRATSSLGPVVWMQHNGVGAISHFAELTSALRNHKVSSSGRGVSINEGVTARLSGNNVAAVTARVSSCTEGSELSLPVRDH